MDLKDIEMFNCLEKKDRKLASQVESVYKTVYETINGISGSYSNYTMHDMGHSLRVAKYMQELAFGIDFESSEDTDKKFNPFEIAIMFLSAILHDIGMVIRPEDEEEIKKNNIKYTDKITYSGILSVVNGNENEAIKEIVRITHARRIKEFINYDFDGKKIYDILMLDDKYPYADDISDICIGHGENYDYIKSLRNNSTKGNYSYNPQYISVLLRVADYLDLDKQRTPVLWYKIMRIDGFSKEEWEKHFIIHNEKKLKMYNMNKMQIFFEGKSSNAKIHRSYLKYIDNLKQELENADATLNVKDSNPNYAFNVVSKIDDRVSTEGFKYSDLRLSLDYSAITELLMGKNIYGDKKLGLRELIQNSIDACKIMKEIIDNGFDYPIVPNITINISKEHEYVKIKDTGIGMTLDIIKKHFLNVGKSYYKSNEFNYRDYKYKPIGNFGIGFLACFLLSKDVIVKTRYYNRSEIIQIELLKDSEYVVTNTEETGTFFGTEITLNYKEFFDVFIDNNHLRKFLEYYFFTDIDISIKDEDAKDTINIQNSCDEYLKMSIQKLSINTNFEDIKCENHSKTIKGIIKYGKKSKHQKFDVKGIDGNCYFYNPENKKLENNVKCTTGHYHVLEYHVINHEEYEKISSTRKSDKSKRNNIISISQKCLSLFFSSDLQIGFYDIDNSDDYIIEVDHTPINEILINNGYEYYKELVNEYSYLTHIFLYNNKYINMSNSVIGWDFYDSFSNDIKINRRFYFYNKDILVDNFSGYIITIPFDYNICGYINFIKSGLKLDVSRNRIIENSEAVELEITNIILRFMTEKITDSNYKELVEEIIRYNEHEINQLGI